MSFSDEEVEDIQQEDGEEAFHFDEKGIAGKNQDRYLNQSYETPVTESNPEKKTVMALGVIYGIMVPLVFIAGVFLGYYLWGIEAKQVEERIVIREVLGTPATSSQSSVTENTPTEGSGEDPSQPNNPQAGTVSANEEDVTEKRQVTRYDVPIANNPVIGPEDAKITIIEFSDYECPFCAKWHREVYYRLLENYPDDVRIVFRDFPLTNIHPQAVPAAIAANCAHDQGKYWEYHDFLFGGTLGLSRQAYTQYADNLGLNLADFLSCLDEDGREAEVMADFEFAAGLGVRSTPTFFINGIALVGAQPYEVFQQIIDAELNGEFE